LVDPVKALVFLLVLANLLFYAFSEGYFGQPDSPDAERVEKQILPERMRIVSAAELQAKPVKEPPVVAPPVARPELVTEEVKVEKSGKPEAKALICLAWEHLPVSDADRLNALLASKFSAFKVTRTVSASGANGWWVHIPPLPGKAEADKKAGELRQFGVTDYFIVPDGQSRFAISLGVFSSEKGGRERLAELKEKGIRSARLMPRPDKDDTVNLQATGPDGARATLLEAVGKALPKAHSLDCK
jgi:hypothetical protein